MIRFWTGLFLLASSWLMGTDYYYPAQWVAWAGLVAGGVWFVVWSQYGAVPGPDGPATTPTEQASGAVSRTVVAANLCLVFLLVPAVIWAPWPHRLAPLLVGLGSTLALAAGRIPRLGGVAQGSVLAGLLFWVQDLVLLAYRHGTARSHELPWPFPAILAGMARLLQVDAGLEESNLMLPTMRHTHALGATWGLFLDPATVCFLASGLMALLLAAWTGSSQSAQGHVPAGTEGSASVGRRRSRGRSGVSGAGQSWMIPVPWRPWVLWLVAAGLWLPLRAGLLMGLYLHRALLTDYEATFDLMNQFWNPWLLMILLWPLAWLQGRWIGAWPAGRVWIGLAAPRPVWEKTVVRVAALSGVATVCLALGILWDPVGERKGGRVGIDEFHSKWEPTDRPFDTEYYGHLSGYNYACIYDYSARHFAMSRVTNALNDALLSDLDVLIVKVPTEPYAQPEIDAILRFVERGGGLLLVGEHTDVFGTGYNLNAIARRFGFGFRYDCLFGIESFFDQYYEPSFVPHPVVQHLRGMDFATSCSIEPRGGTGRGVITSTGLKNSMADYHASNYYPQAVDHAAMRYGAFVQLWAARHGRGRVLAFTDSTIFSNFSVFEPGKSELWLGMVEWLNRQDALGQPRPLLLVLGSALLALSLFWLRKEPAAALPAVATAALSWTLACTGLVRWQHSRLPPPPRSDPLSKSPSTAPSPPARSPKTDSSRARRMGSGSSSAGFCGLDTLRAGKADRKRWPVTWWCITIRTRKSQANTVKRSCAMSSREAGS